MPFRRARKNARGKKRVSSKVPKKTKAYVKRMLDRRIEDKMYMADLVGTASLNNELILTPSTSTLPLYFSCIPSISQGTGLQNRTGTKVRIKRCTLDIQLLLSAAAITSNVDVPYNIYYFLLQDKDTPATLSASDLNQLFYYSGGTTQFLSGSGWASTHQLNRDYFNIIKTNYPRRPLKLGYSSYSVGVCNNNDYKSNIRFTIDYTKAVNKVLHFNNNNSTALDHSWYLCVYIQKENLDTTTASWDAPQMYVSQCIKYEDA